MSVWHWLNGSVRVGLTGGLGERFLNECSQVGAVVEDVCPTEFGFELSTSPQDLSTMRMIARRCRCALTVLERRGAPFRLRRLHGRYGLALGALLAVGILTWEPHSVWNINFYDFTPEQEKRLRDALYEQGVCEGARVDDELLNAAESRILAQEKEFGWLQLNFVHGRIVVEKTDAAEKPDDQTQQELTCLIAAADGIVREFDLQGGYIQVEPGQAVARGELLVNAATVGKRTGKILYSPAKGRVLAETRREYRCFVPFEMSVRTPSAEDRQYMALITPAGRVELGEAEYPEDAFVSVRAEPLTLLGLHLPLTLERSFVRPCDTETVRLTAEQAADIAQSRIYDALNSTLENYELLDRELDVQETEDGISVTMRFCILTDIARQVPYTAQMQPEISEEFR